MGLYREDHQFDSFLFVFSYWIDLFPCRFPTVIYVLKSINRLKEKV